jgi:UDP-glucuronate 4-epimerase
MCCFLGRSGCVSLSATLVVATVLWWHNRAVPEYYSPAPWWLQSELSQLPSTCGPAGTPVVLLTGMAGFIGYHTAERLHAEGTAVIGVDNFNHYYDPALKAARAANLRKAAAEGGAYLRLFQGDACDGDLLKLLLREGRVTHVIHLAAQAGVRYSLKNPLAYVEANVK